MPHTCPVCGYPGLADAPRTSGGGGSYEICPSCGFQFGVSDEDRGHSFEAWRRAWQQKGMPWTSQSKAPPPRWDPAAQLRRIAPKPSRNRQP